jgi:hypothetical protein
MTVEDETFSELWKQAGKLREVIAQQDTELLSARSTIATLTEQLKAAEEDADRLYGALLTSAPYPTSEYKQAIEQHESRNQG